VTPDHVVVIQARFSSSRLPGKVLADMNGSPMLGVLLDRLRTNEDVVVATSDERSDDTIAAFCEERAVTCVRGPLDDVLARFVLAVEHVGNPPVVVRLTADNPTVDRFAVEAALAALRHAPDPGVSNHHPGRINPYGYAVEALRTSALSSLHRDLADDDPRREHVTAALWERGLMLGFDLGESEGAHLRWTVDFPADFTYVAELLRAVGRLFALEEGVEWSSLHPHPHAP